MDINFGRPGSRPERGNTIKEKNIADLPSILTDGYDDQEKIVYGRPAPYFHLQDLYCSREVAGGQQLSLTWECFKAQSKSQRK